MIGLGTWDLPSRISCKGGKKSRGQRAACNMLDSGKRANSTTRSMVFLAQRLEFEHVFSATSLPTTSTSCPRLVDSPSHAGHFQGKIHGMNSPTGTGRFGGFHFPFVLFGSGIQNMMLLSHEPIDKDVCPRLAIAFSRRHREARYELEPLFAFLHSLQ